MPGDSVAIDDALCLQLARKVGAPSAEALAPYQAMVVERAAKGTPTTLFELLCSNGVLTVAEEEQFKLLARLLAAPAPTPPVETASAPVETAAAPVETAAAPVETALAAATPTPTTPEAAAPVEVSRAPVETTPVVATPTPTPPAVAAPVEVSSAPAETTPAPATPAPATPAPAAKPIGGSRPTIKLPPPAPATPKPASTTTPALPPKSPAPVFGLVPNKPEPAPAPKSGRSAGTTPSDKQVTKRRSKPDAPAPNNAALVAVGIVAVAAVVAFGILHDSSPSPADTPQVAEAPASSPSPTPSPVRLPTRPAASDDSVKIEARKAVMESANLEIDGDVVLASAKLDFALLAAGDSAEAKATIVEAQTKLLARARAVMAVDLDEIGRQLRRGDPAASTAIRDLVAHTPPALRGDLEREVARLQQEVRDAARSTPTSEPGPTSEPRPASDPAPARPTARPSPSPDSRPDPAAMPTPDPAADPAAQQPPEDPVDADDVSEAIDRDSPNLKLHPGAKPADQAAFDKAVAKFWEAHEAHLKSDKNATALTEQASGLLKTVRIALPREPAIVFFIGLTNIWTHDAATAQTNLARAIDMNLRFHEALTWISQLEEAASKQDSALKRLGRALELKPDFAPALFRRALFLGYQGKFKEAHADVVKLLELYPKNRSARSVAMVVDGPAWTEKFEKESEHYLVRTDVSQEFADEISKQAELIYKLYASRELFKDPIPQGWPRKFPVIVFKSSDEYHTTTGMPEGVLGHYSPQLRQLYLFLREDQDSTLRVLYHEGFHQFLHPHLRSAPIWFNEGMAEYFGSTQHVRSASGTDGMKVRSQPGRVRDAQSFIRNSGGTVSWKRLWNLPHAQFMDAKLGPYMYALSWSIVYFLCQYDNGENVDILLDYYKALRAGATPAAACDAALDGHDLKDLEKKWAEFVLGMKPE